MDLPSAIITAVEPMLQAAGDASAIRSARSVNGGDINQAACIETAEAVYFVKWLNNAPYRFFECEADGLRRLDGSGTSRVPNVIGTATVSGTDTALLVLEWIATTGKSAQAAETMGRQLADQHRARQAYYGLEIDNFIGKLPQPNLRSNSWIEFYSEQRIGAQMAQAQANALMPAHRRRGLESLIQHLPKWIDESDCQPSLLHGDLWGGNWMQAASGEPVLIDPAVYYGDREADLAMTSLFGGFPQRFYDAYEEVLPLASGYQERQAIYQLYYLLCHLNLFGEGYGGQVDTILHRYLS